MVAELSARFRHHAAENKVKEWMQYQSLEIADIAENNQHVMWK